MGFKVREPRGNGGGQLRREGGRQQNLDGCVAGGEKPAEARREGGRHKLTASVKAKEEEDTWERIVDAHLARLGVDR